MTAESHAARLSFLEKASAALLAIPTVSSWLEREKTVALHETGRLVHTNLKCTGCSRLLLLGYSCDVLNSPRTRKDRLNGNPAIKRCKCNACGATNSIPAKNARRHRRPATRFHRTEKMKVEGSSSNPTISQRSTAAKQSPPHTTNEPPLSLDHQAPSRPSTSSKKRGRGKNTSLQALLANKKPEAPKKAGFDFTDFLKG